VQVRIQIEQSLQVEDDLEMERSVNRNSKEHLPICVLILRSRHGRVPILWNPFRVWVNKSLSFVTALPLSWLQKWLAAIGKMTMLERM